MTSKRARVEHTLLVRAWTRRLRIVSVGVLVAAATAVLTTGYITAQGRQAANAPPPITIQKQGSFAVGGKILGDPDSRSLHCDHGYVDYEIPVKPRKINLVMWHSASPVAWMNRWDGGEGYQSIFLRRGYPVYLWDGPHVGRANWGCTGHTYEPATGADQRNFTSWRFGATYPNWHEGVQFPTKDAEALNQAMRSRYFEFDTVDNAQLQSDAAAKLFDRIGPSVAVANSGAGMRAVLTGLKTKNVAALVLYEGVGYVYPQGEGLGRAPNGFGPIEVPLDEFKKLTRFPIQIVWGDNIGKTNWATTREDSKLFVEKINKYGGKAQLVDLPAIGIKGNTHVPFADMNNVALADQLSKFFAAHGLDKR